MCVRVCVGVCFFCRIVDDAVRSAEIALLGWTAQEAEQADGQARLSFEHGGHDMEPRSEDRYLLHLAAWLDSMEEAPAEGDECNHGLSKITRRTVLEHPLLGPRLERL